MFTLKKIWCQYVDCTPCWAHLFGYAITRECEHTESEMLDRFFEEAIYNCDQYIVSTFLNEILKQEGLEEATEEDLILLEAMCMEDGGEFVKTVLQHPEILQKTWDDVIFS